MNTYSARSLRVGRFARRDLGSGHVGVLVATAAATLVLATSCGEPAPERASLLLITTSSLRADTLPCYGAPTSEGSAICDLADRGALFVWAFTTTPSVAPAAATMLTSQLPAEHGLEVSAASFLRSSAVTLAGEFQREGYATAAFIAAPELNRSRNLQLGFDRYESGDAESLGRSAERVTERATRWIRHASGFDQAFFVWVHFPATASDNAPPLRGVALLELDAYVRELVEAVRASGGEDEDEQGAALSPGIAFAALSGAEREAGRAARGNALDIERVRVPLIWSPPGGVLPQRLLAPIPLLDVAPTLLHSAGLGVPESFAGEGLRVGPLPPAAPRPARPLELESETELGLVLSRRFYAKRRGGRIARTALLSNDGILPAMRSVSPSADEVSEHERLLAEGQLRRAEPDSSQEASRAGAGFAASPASETRTSERAGRTSGPSNLDPVRNDLSAPVEPAFRSPEDQTASRSVGVATN